jgi:hypothetical protein
MKPAFPPFGALSGLLEPSSALLNSNALTCRSCCLQSPTESPRAPLRSGGSGILRSQPKAAALGGSPTVSWHASVSDKGRAERRAPLSNIFPGFGEAHGALSRETAMLASPLAPRKSPDARAEHLEPARSPPSRLGARPPAPSSAELDAMEGASPVVRAVADAPDQAQEVGAQPRPQQAAGDAAAPAGEGSAAQEKEEGGDEEEEGPGPSSTQSWPRAAAQGPERRPSVLAVFPEAGKPAGPAKPPKVLSLIASFSPDSQPLCSS